MKTFITLSSILAAGTLAVNAATTIDTTLTATVSGNGGSTSDSISMTTAYSSVLPDMLDVEALLTSSCSQMGIGSAGAAVNFYAPNLNVGTVGTGDGWTAKIDFTNFSDFQEISSIKLDFGLFALSGVWQSESATWSSGTMTFTAVVKAGEVTLGSFTENIETTYKGNGNQSRDTLTLTGSAVDVSSYDTISVSVTPSVNGWTGGTFVGFTSLALVGRAIPEPSAFGLLAGLGALALAGTRRRRR